MKTALLLIDLQNDYFPDGKKVLEESNLAVEKAEMLLRYYREKALPIIHVQHISVSEDATFFLPGTEGVDIHDKVKPLNKEIVIQKHFPNSFRHTKLFEVLTQLETEHLVICGMMSHMCIDSSTRAAFDLGFHCTIIEDACATTDLQFGKNTIKAATVHGTIMASLNGTFAKVVSAHDFFEKIY